MKKKRKQYKIDRNGILFNVYKRKNLGWEFINGCLSLKDAEKYIEDAKQFPKYY